MKDGSTLRDHFDSFKAQTGRIHPEAEYEGEGYEPLLYIYNLFQEISSGRQSGGFARNPLAWEGIRGYCEQMNVYISPSETRVIKRLDQKYLAALAEKTTNDGHRKDRTRG